jgi:hypothetical protein
MSFIADAHDPSARYAGTSPRDAWGGRISLLLGRQSRARGVAAHVRAVVGPELQEDRR